LEIEVAVAKVGKYATTESGDTFEMVERPRGGLSFVLADGQRSGRGAKFISNLVSRKAVSLLGEGVRDEAAAQAAHDYLFAYRGGTVSSTLNIVTVDLDRSAIRLCRNNPIPVLICAPEGIELFDEPSERLGFYAETHPQVRTVPARLNTHVVVATDGLASAGQRAGSPIDMVAEVRSFFEIGGFGAERLAEALLGRALELESGRPGDDISIVVVAVVDRDSRGVRRLVTRIPFTPPAPGAPEPA
jgi:serine phosphatase RsbU (regulator of sigma subunit)